MKVWLVATGYYADADSVWANEADAAAYAEKLRQIPWLSGEDDVLVESFEVLDGPADDVTPRDYVTGTPAGRAASRTGS